jgi:signal transduction histidine kinase
MSHSVYHLYRNSVALLCALLIALLAVSLVGLSFFESRRHAQHELDVQARMIALTLAKSPAFSSDKALENELKTAGVNPLLQIACMLDVDGKPRAMIHGRDADASFSCEQATTLKPELRTIVVHAPVIDPVLGKPLGDIWLMGRIPTMQVDGSVWLAVAVVIGLFFSLMCWALGKRLENTLMKPIRHIATTAQRVSLYKDYSLRVVSGALNVMPREIESLSDSFNGMLDEIEDRNSRLTRKTRDFEKARIDAEAANVAKSQFLANVSHELRTPLNAIIGFSTMLHEEQFGPLGNAKYTEYARDIHDSGKHLLDVINDILDLSKAETGTLSMVWGSVSLQKIIEKALNIVAGQAHHRKIDIYTDFPEKMPKMIADRVRVMQILLNVLSNAIKFTPEGGKIIIRAFAEAAKNGVHYFTIEVEDSGIGMSQASIDKAFSSFNQGDAGLNRRYEGAGLGLPLTKRLVDLHHGKIKISSSEGHGTKVTVRLTSDPALLD